MFTKEGTLSRIVVVRLEPNDDVLIELENAVKTAGIENGAILGAIGAVKSYGFHVVKETTIPPGNVYFYEKNLAYDILSCTGFILGTRVHAHVTVGNRGRVIGGHLESGMRVLNMAVITIGQLEELDLIDLDRYVVPNGDPLRR